MFSLFNVSSIFPGGSADPICPYVRTPMSSSRLRLRFARRNYTSVYSTDMTFVIVAWPTTAASLIGRNAVTWRSSLSSDEHVGGRPCNIAMLRPRATFSTSVHHICMSHSLPCVICILLLFLRFLSICRPMTRWDRLIDGCVLLRGRTRTAWNRIFAAHVCPAGLLLHVLPPPAAAAAAAAESS